MHATSYYENNQKKDYQLLLVIDKEYKYLVYTDLDNHDYKKNLYVVKTASLNASEEVSPMDDNEWKMVETTYQNLINI